MSVKLIGDTSIIWGVRPTLPLKGFPEGKIKLRLRNNSFAKAFVKTKQGIRSFYVAEKDGFWIPKYEQGSNNMEVIS